MENYLSMNSQKELEFELKSKFNICKWLITRIDYVS